jgi:hypothetical protein
VLYQLSYTSIKKDGKVITKETLYSQVFFSSDGGVSEEELCVDLVEIPLEGGREIFKGFGVEVGDG